MHTACEIPSVNFHLWKPCNMSCQFCFATFQDFGRDILPKGHLAPEDCMAVVEALAEAGFEKINFAGGANPLPLAPSPASPGQGTGSHHIRSHQRLCCMNIGST